MTDLMLQSISFNVSKTINIGNFEAIKINYGESVAVDPTRDVEEQRKEMIDNCYEVVGRETKVWQGLKAIQHVDSQKNTTIHKAKSYNK